MTVSKHVNYHTAAWHIRLMQAGLRIIVISSRYEQYVDILQVLDDNMSTMGEINTAIDVCGNNNIRSMEYFEARNSLLMGGKMWLKRMEIKWM